MDLTEEEDVKRPTQSTDEAPRNESQDEGGIGPVTEDGNATDSQCGGNQQEDPDYPIEEESNESESSDKSNVFLGFPRSKHTVESIVWDLVAGVVPSTSKSRSLSLLPSIEESDEDDGEALPLQQNSLTSASSSSSPLSSAASPLLGSAVVQKVCSKPALTSITEESMPKVDNEDGTFVDYSGDIINGKHLECPTRSDMFSRGKVDPDVNNPEVIQHLLQSDKGHGDVPIDQEPVDDVALASNSGTRDKCVCFPGGEGHMKLQKEVKKDIDILPISDVIVNVVMQAQNNMKSDENVVTGEGGVDNRIANEGDASGDEKGERDADEDTHGDDAMAQTKQETSDDINKDETETRDGHGTVGQSVYTLYPEFEKAPEQTNVDVDKKGPTFIKDEDNDSTDRSQDSFQVGSTANDEEGLVHPNCDDDKRTAYNKAKGSGSDSKITDTTMSSCDVSGARESHSEHTVPSGSSEKHEKEAIDRDKDKEREGNKRKRERGVEETNSKQCLKNAVGDVRGRDLGKSFGKSEPHKFEILGSDVKTTCRLEYQIADTAANDTHGGQPISETSHQEHQGSLRESDSVSNSLNQSKRFGKRKGKRRKKSTESFAPVEPSSITSQTPISNEIENESQDSLASSNCIDFSLSVSHLDIPVSSETNEQTDLDVPVVNPTHAFLTCHDASLNNPVDPNPVHVSDSLTKDEESVSVGSDQHAESSDQDKDPSHESQSDIENPPKSSVSTSEFMSLNKSLQGEEQASFFTAKETLSSETNSTQSTVSRNELVTDTDSVHAKYGGGPQTDNSCTGLYVQPDVESEEKKIEVVRFKQTAVILQRDPDKAESVGNDQISSSKENEGTVSELSQDGDGTEATEGDQLNVISNLSDSIVSEEHIPPVILDTISENESECEIPFQDGLDKANLTYPANNEESEPLVVLACPADDLSSLESEEIHQDQQSDNHGTQINADSDAHTELNVTWVECKEDELHRHGAEEDHENEINVYFVNDVQTMEEGDIEHTEKEKCPGRGVEYEEGETNMTLRLQQRLEETDSNNIAYDEGDGGKANGEGIQPKQDLVEEENQTSCPDTEQREGNNTEGNKRVKEEPDQIEQEEKVLLAMKVMGDNVNDTSSDDKQNVQKELAIATGLESMSQHDPQGHRKEDHDGQNMRHMEEQDTNHEQEKSEKINEHEEVEDKKEDDVSKREENEEDFEEKENEKYPLGVQEERNQGHEEEKEQNIHQLILENRQTDDICRHEQKEIGQGNVAREEEEFKQCDDTEEETNKSNGEKLFYERRHIGNGKSHCDNLKPAYSVQGGNHETLRTSEEILDVENQSVVSSNTVRTTEENGIPSPIDLYFSVQPKNLAHSEEFNSYRPKAFDLESCTMSLQAPSDNDDTIGVTEGPISSVPNVVENDDAKRPDITVTKDNHDSSVIFCARNDDDFAIDSEIINTGIIDNSASQSVTDPEIDNFINKDEKVKDLTNHGIIANNITERDRCLHPDNGYEEIDNEETNAKMNQSGGGEFIKDTIKTQSVGNAEPLGPSKLPSQSDTSLEEADSEDRDQPLEEDPREETDKVLEEDPRKARDLVPEEEPRGDPDQVLKKEASEGKCQILEEYPREDIVLEEETREDKDQIPQENPREYRDQIIQEEPREDKDQVLQEETREDKDQIPQENPREYRDQIIQEEAREDKDQVLQEDTREDRGQALEEEPREDRGQVLEEEAHEDRDQVLEEDTREDRGQALEEEPRKDRGQVLEEEAHEDRDQALEEEPREDRGQVLEEEPREDRDLVIEEESREDRDLVIEEEPREDRDLVIEEESREDRDLVIEEESREDRDLVIEEEAHEDKDLVIEEEPREDRDLVIEEESREDRDLVIEEEPRKDRDLVIEEESREGRDLVIEEESREDRDLVIEEESREDRDLVIEEEAHEDKDLVIEEEPREDRDLVIEEESREDRDLVIEEEPREAKDLVIEEEPREDRDQVLEEESREDRDLVIEEESREDRDLVIEEEPRKDRDLVIEEESREGRDLVIEEESREDRDLVIEEESREDRDLVIEEEAHEDKDLVIEEEPREDRDLVIEEESREDRDLVIEEEPREAKDLVIEEEPREDRDQVLEEESREDRDLVIEEEAHEDRDLVIEEEPREDRDQVLEEESREDRDLVIEEESREDRDLVIEEESREDRDLVIEEEAHEDKDLVIEEEPREDRDLVIEEESREDRDLVIEEEPREAKDLVIEEEPREDRDQVLEEESREDRDLVIEEESREDRDLVIEEEPREDRDQVLEEESREDRDLVIEEESREDRDLVIEEEPREDRDLVIEEEPREDRDQVLEEESREDRDQVLKNETHGVRCQSLQGEACEDNDKSLQQGYFDKRDEIQQQTHLFPTVIIQTNAHFNTSLDKTDGETFFIKDVSSYFAPSEKVDLTTKQTTKHEECESNLDFLNTSKIDDEPKGNEDLKAQTFVDHEINDSDVMHHSKGIQKSTSVSGDAIPVETDMEMPNAENLCYSGAEENELDETGVKLKDVDKEGLVEGVSDSKTLAQSVLETVDGNETIYCTDADQEPTASTVPTSNGERIRDRAPEFKMTDKKPSPQSFPGQRCSTEKVTQPISTEHVSPTAIDPLEQLNEERAGISVQTNGMSKEDEHIVDERVTTASLVEETKHSFLPQNEAPVEISKKEQSWSYVEEPGRSIDDHKWALVDEEGQRIDDRGHDTNSQGADGEMDMGEIPQLLDSSYTKMESDSLEDESSDSPLPSSWTVWKKKPLWRKVIARLKHPRFYTKAPKKAGKLSKQRTDADNQTETRGACGTDGHPKSARGQGIGKNDDTTDDGWKTLERDDSSLSVSKRGVPPNRSSSSRGQWRRIRRLHRLRKGAEAIPDRLPPVRRHSVTRYPQRLHTGGTHASRQHADTDLSSDHTQGGSKGKTRKKRTDLLLHGHIKEMEMSQREVAANSPPVFEVFCDKDRKEVADLAGSLAAKETPTVRLLMKPLMTGMTAQESKKALEHVGGTSGPPEGGGQLIDETTQIGTRPSKRFSCVVM